MHYRMCVQIKVDVTVYQKALRSSVWSQAAWLLEFRQARPHRTVDNLPNVISERLDRIKRAIHLSANGKTIKMIPAEIALPKPDYVI
jgi:hypothetical protein